MKIAWKDEKENLVCEFLRTNLTDPRSTIRASSKTETFDGDGSTTTFTLTPSTDKKFSAVTLLDIEVSIALMVWAIVLLLT